MFFINKMKVNLFVSILRREVILAGCAICLDKRDLIARAEGSTAKGFLINPGLLAE